MVVNYFRSFTSAETMHVVVGYLLDIGGSHIDYTGGVDTRIPGGGGGALWHELLIREGAAGPHTFPARGMKEYCKLSNCPQKLVM